MQARGASSVFVQFLRSHTPGSLPELTNFQLTHLVTQLRQEAQQWKGQCLRLEQNLRGEISA